MKRLTLEDPESKSEDLIKENIEQLQQIFPEVIKEGKVDLEALNDLLGNYADTPQERFGLNWAGKANARREAQKMSTGTLRPCPEDSVDWENTQNLYIEGDNLEVLKLLQKSYHNKVKMIYIDPPYNTGKDFVYKDNYKDNLKNYLEQTGQDKRTSTNTESDGRYHSNWLNMMYPRLKLARNLLKEDGVIFISIDDNEQSNLKKMCDEIFGEENFVGEIIWETATDNNMTQIAIEHEYILCYAKYISKQEHWYIESEKADIIQKKYEDLKKDNDDPLEIQKLLKKWIMHVKKSNDIDLSGVFHYSYVDEKGVFYPGNSSNTKPGGYSYDIIHPITNKICKKPDNGYRWPKETFDKSDENGNVLWGKDETTIPKIKKRLNTAKELLKSYYYEDNRKSTKSLSLLMDNMKLFDNPKPVTLIQKLLRFTTSKESIILDFFSGSGTTADSTMQLNAKDGGNRKYICVQLPEQTAEGSIARKNKYTTITQIGKERIRRAGKQILEELKAKEDNLFDKKKQKLDIGFKVFKLDSSNLNAWDTDSDDLETELQTSIYNIKNDRTEDDLLYEILLKYGIPLIEKVNKHTFDGKIIYEMGAGSLIICLEENITSKIAEGIVNIWNKVKPEGADIECRVIFKDEGFNGSDEIKANVELILKQHGITNIASI